MADRSVSARLSRDVVTLLIERGYTLTRIAGLLDVTKSFISRVKAGTRSFTLEHLAVLERELGEPIPWLLIDSIPAESVSPELRPLYEMTRKLLKPAQRRARRKIAAA